MKIYISGGIHGLPKDAQEKFFRKRAEEVRLRGHEPVVPHDIPPYHPDEDDDCPPAYSFGGNHSAACHLRGDIIELLVCDAILMIGAWQHSVGAVREHDIACWTGIPVFYKIDEVPVIPRADGYTYVPQQQLTSGGLVHGGFSFAEWSGPDNKPEKGKSDVE